MNRLSGRPQEHATRTPETVDRPELGRMVTNRFVESVYLSVRGISCQERGGVLYLAGRLPNHHLKQVALAPACEVSGTLPIVNDIQVVFPLPRSATES